jgi:hypothetical protein
MPVHQAQKADPAIACENKPGEDKQEENLAGRTLRRTLWGADIKDQENDNEIDDVVEHGKPN